MRYSFSLGYGYGSTNWPYRSLRMVGRSCFLHHVAMHIGWFCGRLKKGIGDG